LCAVSINAARGKRTHLPPSRSILLEETQRCWLQISGACFRPITWRVVISGRGPWGALVPLELGHRGELAARLLDHGIGAVVARPAALRDLLAGDVLRQETAHKGVAGAVGVHELLLGQRDDGEAVQLALGYRI